MNLHTIRDLNLNNKTVIIRVDFNVVIENGIIINDFRLQSSIQTIEFALRNNASVIILSHLGNPTEGKFNIKYSLAPIAKYLKITLNYPIRFVSNYLYEYINIKPQELVLCENVRFNIGEKSNNYYLSKKLSNLGNIFIMDAFGVAHRIHASTYGISQYVPVSASGLLLSYELQSLSKILNNLKNPITMIIGGSKVSNKLRLMKYFVSQVDYIITGGKITNTLLQSQGFNIGNSLYDNDYIKEANYIINLAKQKKCIILLPIDVKVGKTFSNNCYVYNKFINNIENNDIILDIGINTIYKYIDIIRKSRTIIWNGPIGVYEFSRFAHGTKSIAMAIANNDSISIVGGGDTITIINKYNIFKKISYISTGGGSLLQYIATRTLPAINKYIL